MRIYFIPYLTSIENYYSGINEDVPSKPTLREKREPIFTAKRQEFVYPKPYLDEITKLIIIGLLFGFEVLKMTFEDGVLCVQAELDNNGKVLILDEERGSVERQLYEYFYTNFKQRNVSSAEYKYKGKRYQLSINFLDISF